MSAAPTSSAPRYADITEAPGLGASDEQVRMLEARYGLAMKEIGGGRVLEIACGTGIGLSVLAEVADEVIGCDIDDDNIAIAKRTYAASSISIRKADAQKLPFAAESFDALVCFEAIYYFSSVAEFFDECSRVLKKRGKLVLCSVNADWSGFSASPFAVRYLTPAEVINGLERRGFSTRLLGGFADRAVGRAQVVAQLIRRAAVALHLIPRTMRGRARIKQLLFRSTSTLPSRLGRVSDAREGLVELPKVQNDFPYKVFYVVAQRDC